MSDDASLAGLRERLVAEVQATSGIRDERIAAALRDVPRHLFLPHLPPEDAYLDDAIVTKRAASTTSDWMSTLTTVPVGPTMCLSSAAL